MVQNSLDKTFKRLKEAKKKALIAYITAGFPRLKEEGALIQVLDQSGVDVLEIGVPFSDPIADGPTIQFASQASLKYGTSLRQILPWAKKLKLKVSMPFVIMSYMNPILSYGLSAFARDAFRSGISGVIIPDLIPEEGKAVEEALQKRHIHLIYLISPTTPPSRQRQIAQKSGGFIYAVAVTGVTGARRKYTPKTKKWLGSLSGLSRKPVCAGFGISGPAQIHELKPKVDGFIIGSALIDLIRKNKGRKRWDKISQFIGQLAKECHDACRG